MHWLFALFVGLVGYLIFDVFRHGPLFKFFFRRFNTIFFKNRRLGITSFSLLLLRLLLLLLFRLLSRHHRRLVLFLLLFLLPLVLLFLPLLSFSYPQVSSWGSNM